MRTTIDIDKRLMKDAMRSCGASTMKATVEAGLRLLIQVQKQTLIRRHKGKVRWEGNLKRLRRARFYSPPA